MTAPCSSVRMLETEDGGFAQTVGSAVEGGRAFWSWTCKCHMRQHPGHTEVAVTASSHGVLPSVVGEPSQEITT